MKAMAFIATTVLSINAFADYANITCSSETSNRTVTLSMDSYSEAAKDNTYIEVNGKSAKISNLQVQQTDYGVLAITAQVGQGPGKYQFAFKNLGDSECFGVYGSKTTGPASVDVINSLGVIAKLPCTCAVD